jgi:Fe-S cluster assembly ATP-binding protein
MTELASASSLLEIQGLHVAIEGKEILRGVDLVVRPGEIHALMGRNGSGKSTLAYTLMGHPKYQVTAGRMTFNGEDLSRLSPDQRARLGVFLGFQYPITIPGVTTGNFLRSAVKAVRGDSINAVQFRKDLTAQMQRLQIDPSFATRSLNEGFSGGEKKRAEVLQMAVLQPKLAVLDEPDSGLDIDAVKVVSQGIAAVHQDLPATAMLLITHYERILRYLELDQVHVMARGRIVQSGGRELAAEIVENGYEAILQAFGLLDEEEITAAHGR